MIKIIKKKLEKHSRKRLTFKKTLDIIESIKKTLETPIASDLDRRELEVMRMKQVNFPVCRQQKAFEDIATSIIKILADLQEEQQLDLHEYAVQLFNERFDFVHKRWNER